MAILIDKADAGHFADDTSLASIAFTTSQAVVSSGFIVVAVSWGDSTTTLSSVAGGGLTWVIDIQGGSVGAGCSCAFASAQAPSGLASSTTLTGNFSGATVGRGISGTSFTGVATSSPLDTSSGPVDIGGAGAWATPSTTIAAGSVLLGLAHDTSTNSTSTTVSPSIEAQDFGGGAGSFEQVVGYRIEAVGGAFTVAGTLTAADVGAVIGVAYKAAAGGGGGGGGSNAPEKLRVVQSSQRW